jgi:hypothetical protein
MQTEKNQCVLCERTSDEVPLIQAEFKGQHFTVCSQHLPVLIHDPAQLAGKLPGAEGLQPAEHHD